MTDTYRAKRVSLQVWITEDLRDELKHLAIERHQSVTDLVRAALAVEKCRPKEAVNFALNPWVWWSKR